MQVPEAAASDVPSTKTYSNEAHRMLGTILIVILVLALFGALPRWSHSRSWGYYPTGGIGLLLVIVVVLLLLGRI
jgi:FtsH-binding integral membrane protein